MTARLFMRPFRENDAAAACTIARDWEVARWTARIPHPYEVKMAVDWIADGANRRASGEELGYAITRRADDTLIGGVGLTFVDDPGAAELGFFLGKRFWGQGFMGEAVGAVLDAGFTILKLETVWASTAQENARSAALQERHGFTYVETRDETAPARGGTMTVDVRRLDRTVWLDRREPGERA